LRAAANLGWKEMPAIIRDMDDKTVLTLALIENLQRTDLNPIEEGEGYQRLSQEFGLTQQQIAETVGKDRSTVANMLRVLQLPSIVRDLLQQGKLTLGHAKVLLGVSDPVKLETFANDAVSQGWTVRELEKRIRDVVEPNQGKKKGGRPRSDERRSPELKSVEDRIRRFFQTDVRLTSSPENRGSLTIEFYSADDLERILEIMGIPR
jgi:ParB family chromosome partitioning protein